MIGEIERTHRLPEGVLIPGAIVVAGLLVMASTTVIPHDSSYRMLPMYAGAVKVLTGLMRILHVNLRHHRRLEGEAMRLLDPEVSHRVEQNPPPPTLAPGAASLPPKEDAKPQSHPIKVGAKKKIKNKQKN